MIRLTIYCGLLYVVLGCGLASADGCVQPDALRNTDTPYSLWGKCLEFRPLSLGSRLPLGSIVYFPIQKDGGSLTISVDRSALTRQFVEDLFDQPDHRVIAKHQLAQKGVRLVLTPKRLKVTIYPSVIVSLRSDILDDPKYRSFISRPTFVVEEIAGKAFASTDLDRISTAFFDVYIQYLMHASTTSRKELPDGSTQGSSTISDLLPLRQLPSKANE